MTADKIPYCLVRHLEGQISGIFIYFTGNSVLQIKSFIINVSGFKVEIYGGILKFKVY